ncbi:hypothetical protein HDU98_001303, partial [Podochytrium sp. JEL0797]
IVAFSAIGFTFIVSLADTAVNATKYTSGKEYSGFALIATGVIFMSGSVLYWIVMYGMEDVNGVENGLGNMHFTMPVSKRMSGGQQQQQEVGGGGEQPIELVTGAV